MVISNSYNDQSVGDGSNSELCNIIRLCPLQPQNQVLQNYVLSQQLPQGQTDDVRMTDRVIHG